MPSFIVMNLALAGHFLWGRLPGRCAEENWKKKKHYVCNCLQRPPFYHPGLSSIHSKLQRCVCHVIHRDIRTNTPPGEHGWPWADIANQSECTCTMSCLRTALPCPVSSGNRTHHWPDLSLAFTTLWLCGTRSLLLSSGEVEGNFLIKNTTEITLVPSR